MKFIVQSVLNKFAYLTAQLRNVTQRSKHLKPNARLTTKHSNRELLNFELDGRILFRFRVLFLFRRKQAYQLENVGGNLMLKFVMKHLY